jgi:hypothetical protein
VAARRQFHRPIDLQRTGEEASLNPPDMPPPKVAIVTGAARGIGAAVSFLAREESDSSPAR